jgi:serine phosphatase RsbU (regulator of sigma subunit)
VRPGSVAPVCWPGPLLGAFPDARSRRAVIDLEQGGSLVLYTDGVTDTRGADGRFGPQRLEQVLASAAGRDADEVATAVDNALSEYEVGAQRDDVALLVLSAAEARTTQNAESSAASA